MNRPFRRAPIPLPRLPRSDAGVTLVELLVALLISGLFVPLIWISIRGAIQFFEATIWQVQLERDLDRLTALIDAEAEDACRLGTDADPAPCIPPATELACDTDTENQLSMRVTLLDANNAPAGTGVITYTRNDNNDELLRTGPLILNTGRLDPTNTQSTGQLVMRGVTGFDVDLADDCNTAIIVVTVQPVAPNVFTAGVGTGNDVTRTFGLRTGSRPFVD